MRPANSIRVSVIHYALVLGRRKCTQRMTGSRPISVDAVNHMDKTGRPSLGRLTTHVLDTRNGEPGAGMTIEFSVLEAGRWRPIKTVSSNADGRTDEPLLAGEAMKTGEYRLVFHVAAYFRAKGDKLPEPPFLERVPIRFGIADPAAHYHVPLLCSPWSYSTYRGS